MTILGKGGHAWVWQGGYIHTSLHSAPALAAVKSYEKAEQNHDFHGRAPAASPRHDTGLWLAAYMKLYAIIWTGLDRRECVPVMDMECVHVLCWSVCLCYVGVCACARRECVPVLDMECVPFSRRQCVPVPGGPDEKSVLAPALPA
jgi:hypothetical protein